MADHECGDELPEERVCDDCIDGPEPYGVDGNVGPGYPGHMSTYQKLGGL